MHAATRLHTANNAFISRTCLSMYSLKLAESRDRPMACMPLSTYWQVPVTAWCIDSMCVFVRVCACGVCVCVRERETERFGCMCKCASTAAKVLHTHVHMHRHVRRRIHACYTRTCICTDI